jgi:hypothetical protein
LRRRIGTYTMYIVLCEAAIFGSGQMLHLGPATLKMILFALSMLYVAVALLAGDRLTTPTVALSISYLAVLLLGSILGLFRGAQPGAIETDLSSLLPVLFLPFFELTIRDLRHVQIARRILMFASGVICGGYLLAMALLLSGKLNFVDMAVWLTNVGNSDFLIDESTGRVFYKGALYIGIAAIFFLFREGPWSKLAAFLTLPALVVVGARGFFLGLFLTGLLYLAIGPIRIVKKVTLILLVILVGSAVLSGVSFLVGDRTTSNTTRIVIVQQALDRIDLLTAVVGNGLGVGVPMRPAHMEISYLEILYKQGALGLCWWGAAFLFLLTQFRRALRSGHGRLAYPFFLSGIFIAFESFTNPYLNNPIGLTFMTAAVACLAVLGRTDSRTMTYDFL